jgi:hypothetical protein
MTYDVFICHSTHDKAVADQVCATLEKSKIRCWIAPRDVPPGRSWPEAIVEAIGKSRLFVLILSKVSNASKQVERELMDAMDKGIPVITFRIEDVEPSKYMGYYIKNIQWLDALTPPLKKHLQKLADTVQVNLTELESASPALATPPVTHGEDDLHREAAPRSIQQAWLRLRVPLLLAFSILVLIALWLSMLKAGILKIPAWISTSAPPPVTMNTNVPTNNPNPYFNIYTDAGAQDNHFLPTGKMGDTGDIVEINQSSTDNPYSGLTAMRFEYDALGLGAHLCPFGLQSETTCQWAGLYWLNPADNWGTVKDAGFSLTGFTKLSFQVRAEAASSGAVIKFMVGGAGCQIPTVPPYPDSVCPPKDSGWVRLTDQWQHFEIALTDTDLSYVIGGFAWVIDWGSNEISVEHPKRIIFYLDEIRFER